MKKTLIALAAGSLMSVAGFASASEPMQLTENQMDAVAAGTFGGISVVSEAGGTAFAKHGSASSSSSTVASAGSYYVSSSSSNTASGWKARAASGAKTTITFGGFWF